MSAQIDSTERFVLGLGAAVPGYDFITPGVQFELSVPLDAELRSIWIAAGSYYQVTDADSWWIQGKLEFWWEGEKVGKLEFSDASALLSAVDRQGQIREIVRMSPPATGSTQPSLRIQQVPSTGVARDNLDLGCIQVRVRCNRVTFEIEKSRLIGVQNTFAIGCRIVSSQ